VSENHKSSALAETQRGLASSLALWDLSPDHDATLSPKNIAKQTVYRLVLVRSKQGHTYRWFWLAWWCD